MHPTNGFVRRSAPILAALILAACDSDAPTNAMSAVEAGPSSVVTPGFPIDGRLVLDQSSSVDHNSFFRQPEVSERLLEWLPS